MRTVPQRYSVFAECFQCENSFMIESDIDEVSYCPFCGEELEEKYNEEDDD